MKVLLMGAMLRAGSCCRSNAQQWRQGLACEKLIDEVRLGDVLRFLIAYCSLVPFSCYVSVVSRGWAFKTAIERRVHSSILVTFWLHSKEKNGPQLPVRNQ